MRDVESLITGRPPSSRSVMITARVVRSDAGGVLASPLGSDQRHPLGPCRGARYLRAITQPSGGTSHSHALEYAQLPVGSVVLLVLTTGAPWIASYDLPGSG